MRRIRIIFEKKEWMTFVNHMDLPNLFSRAARRAGFVQDYTQGFSPHPHMSLGPALAISVTGLEEPAEFWFRDWQEGNEILWNEQLPEGLRIIKCAELQEGPSLAKFTTAAVYSIEGDGLLLTKEARDLLDEAIKAIAPLYYSNYDDGKIKVAVGDLNRCGASCFVKALQSAEMITGWADLKMVRETVGNWDNNLQQIIPLI